MTEDKAIKALKIIRAFNPLHNDTEAYLYDVAEWGLGLIDEPNPEDFGIRHIFDEEE